MIHKSQETACNTTNTAPENTLEQRNIYSVTNPPDILYSPVHIHKYWELRYNIFPKFDEGIQFDDEGLFSAIVRSNVKTISFIIYKVFKPARIVDACCGIGGSLINLALMNPTVTITGIELDTIRFDILKNNMHVYGDPVNIRTINGDVFNELPKIRTDVVFCSPPWNGPNNKATTVEEFKFDIIRLKDVVTCACGGVFNCLLHLPRGFPVEEAQKISPESIMTHLDLRLGKTRHITSRLFIYRPQPRPRTEATFAPEPLHTPIVVTTHP
jgi:SAM-dependent methyltransferase